ncbi:MAG: tetratricopeptide repeat protein [Saprospiraceae bacterium]|jgi:tetratricopeptide (TPR) repeat protein|nr:tetratricopeptide repeat protein [Saprospiraceae bacterium]MBL0026573.1 tetratricopeptide repeat protein [Saprospiraceae bacterium]
MKIFSLIAIALSVFVDLHGQSAHTNLRNGDMLYEYGKYGEAETEYRKAESAKSSVKSSYNLANSLMKQERYDEAIKKYDDAVSKASNDHERAATQYNMGNAMYKKQKFKESVDAYKKALRYNPSDIQTKENLALARRELRKQEQQQKKQEDKKDKKENNNNEQNKKDEEQKNKDQQNKEDQKQNGNKPDDSNQNDQKMNRRDAEKLLEIMDNEEKKVQQKLRRVDPKSGKPKKDW